MIALFQNIFFNHFLKTSSLGRIVLTLIILFISIQHSFGQNQNNAQSSEIKVIVTKNNPTGNLNNGSIKLEIEEGQSPYKIHCFSPYLLPTENTGNKLELNNLKPGTYLFIIQDKSETIVSKEVIIEEGK